MAGRTDAAPSPVAPENPLSHRSVTRRGLSVGRMLLGAGVLLISGCLAAAEVGFSDTIAAVVAHPSDFDARRIEKAVVALTVTERIDVLLAWHESQGAWERIVTDIAAPGLRQPSTLARDAFLLATCGEALARTGKGSDARTLLAQGDWMGNGSGPALVQAALGQVAYQEHDWRLARDYLERGRNALRLAGSDDGQAWRTTIADRRLSALSADIERGSIRETLGPDYLLWCDAERIAEAQAQRHDRAQDVLAAYDRVAAEYPTGRYAAPSRLAAARVAWEADLVDEYRGRIRTLLQAKDAQIHGLVCLLAVDGELRFGSDAATVRRLCQEALDWCSSHAPAAPLEDAVRAAIAPTTHPHVMAGWGLPVWHARERTRLWTWDAAPWLDQYVSYQALTRLVVVSVLARNQSAAIDYAQNLSRFDDLDQEMVKQGRQAGPSILAAAIRDKSFFLPVDAWSALAPEAQLRLMTALVYYQLYDWPTARSWAESALAAIPAKETARRKPVLYLIGFTWMGSHDDDRALETWRQITEGKSQPDRFWGLARMAEASLLANRPATQRDALKMLLLVAETLAPSPEAENALERAVNLSENLDPTLCAAAAHRLIAGYPRSIYVPFATAVLARLAQRAP